MEIVNTFDAIVLAGGDGTPIDKTQPVKGMVEICGKPMVQWVVEALRKASSIHRIVVVIPAQALRGSWADGVTVVDSVGTIVENCGVGLKGVDGKRPVMWLPADIPMLTAEAVDDYATRVVTCKADATYALVRAEDIERHFPGSIRTYVKLKDGHLTGGNILTCTADAFNSGQPTITSVLNARKDSMKMARLIGPQIATKYALGRLAVCDVEVRVDKLFNTRKATGIFTPHACIGVDVDKPADKEIAERALSGRRV